MAATMRAAVYRGNSTISVEDVPVPEVGAGEVLLEVSHCGVCGTDLHLIMENWGTPGSIGGHEYSGVVTAVGAGVEGWSVGDRAVGGPGPGCGRCRQCRAGASNQCVDRPRLGATPFTGAFAGFKVVDAHSLYRVPAGLDLRTAALTEPVAVAWRGVRRAGVAPGDRVLVTGAGPIGLITTALLRAQGIDDVTVSEPAPKRRERAARLGAATVIEPGELAQQDDLLPMDVAPRPFEAAVECSGRVEAMEAALANLDRGGTLVLSGTGMRRPRFDPNRMIINELTVTGTAEYTPDDYRAALDVLASGRLSTGDLIEPDDFPLDRLQWGMEQLVAGELAGKVMVVPRA
jgi:(R,R)-butanediol dehydrogenase/meso-butanediol dehydrogenase/diacetyl reductase